MRTSTKLIRLFAVIPAAIAGSFIAIMGLGFLPDAGLVAAFAGTLGVSRPDISTQIRFRKEEELKKGEAALRSKAGLGEKDNIKILTSCPSCLQGLSRYGNDLNNGLLEADYIVVEMARQILGEDWMPKYVEAANQGGIERVLV